MAANLSDFNEFVAEYSAGATYRDAERRLQAERLALIEQRELLRRENEDRDDRMDAMRYAMGSRFAEPGAEESRAMRARSEELRVHSQQAALNAARLRQLAALRETPQPAANFLEPAEIARIVELIQRSQQPQNHAISFDPPKPARLPLAPGPAVGRRKMRLDE